MEEIKGDFAGILPSPKEEKDEKQKQLYKMNKTCGQCDFQFETIKELMFHVKNTPGHVPMCVHCDSKFSNFNNYRHHVRKFHIRESEIVCQECGKTSKTQEQQLLHWNFVHKVEEDLYCNLCGRECQNMFKLRKHTKLCLTKDPDIAAQERVKAEAENERVRLQLQTWTHEQYLEWQQRKAEEANKPKPSVTAKTPRKKKEEKGDKTPRKSTPKKRQTNGSLLYNMLSEFSHVKKLKPEEENGSNNEDFADMMAETNFVDNFFKQQQEVIENGLGHVKDESDFKGVKEECESEDSDHNYDISNDTNDDVFNDTSFNDNTFDDNHDYNMNSDEENMFKAEVKLETESGDESLDYTNDEGELYVPFPKSEVNEEKEKVKFKKSKPKKPQRSPAQPDEEGDFPCDQCGKTYKSRTSLSGHVHQVIILYPV